MSKTVYTKVDMTQLPVPEAGKVVVAIDLDGQMKSLDEHGNITLMGIAPIDIPGQK